MKIADPATAELAAINAILEPFLWVHSYGQPYYGLPGGVATGPYRFEGTVKPDLAKMTRGTPGRALRACLTGRAENMLDALAAAGWQLMDDLRMEVKGRTAPFTQTLAERLVRSLAAACGCGGGRLARPRRDLAHGGAGRFDQDRRFGQVAHRRSPSLPT
ncbi:MAG TPA: hypothetical protein VGS06_19545 [Streptosporangiaceae bacterium]|nr:hypothetical protein [Streptosporangiaceae bacterium]